MCAATGCSSGFQYVLDSDTGITTCNGCQNVPNCATHVPNTCVLDKSVTSGYSKACAPTGCYSGFQYVPLSGGLTACALCDNVANCQTHVSGVCVADDTANNKYRCARVFPGAIP